MRITKYYLKIIIFKLLSFGLFTKLYHIYFNFTAYRRIRERKYFISSKTTLEKHILPIIDEMLLKNKNLHLLDVGCGPDIFNNVLIYDKYYDRVNQTITDKFPKLNKKIYTNSFKYLEGNDLNFKKENFFKINNFKSKDYTKNKISKKYDLLISIYVIEHFNTIELDYFLNNIKGAAKKYIFITNFTDQFFLDKWKQKNDINKFKYLQYSDFMWNIINSKFLFQSRNRINDFEYIFEKNGFKILNIKKCDNFCNEINDEWYNDNFYKNMKINKKYKNYKYSELFTPTGVFIIENKNA